MITAAIALALAGPLTIEGIMNSVPQIGTPPRNVRWTSDGEWVNFSWAKPDEGATPSQKQYKVKKDGTGLSEGSAPSPEVIPPNQNTVERARVTISDGDIYFVPASGGTRVRLTETPETESGAALISNDTEVLYLVGLKIYRLKVADKVRTHVASILEEGETLPPSDGEAPMVVTAPKGHKPRSPIFSPKGTHAWIEFATEVEPAKRADVPNYVTNSGYPEMIATYPRVGMETADEKAVALDLTNGIKTEFEPARKGRIGSPVWSKDGSYAYVVSTTEDHKDEWITGFDPATNQKRVLWNEHSVAWIGGPGRGTLGWYPDGSKIYFCSENSGFSNLYTMDPKDASSTAKPMVDGKYEVSQVRMDVARSRFTFLSSADGPFTRRLEAIGFDGSNRHTLAKLTPDDDMFYTIAPNGEDVAFLRSAPNRPAELFVKDKQITVTPSKEWLAGPWIVPQVVWVPSTDGVKVPSRLYKPKKWKKGGPAVVFVHGAGYLQNVYDGWSHYFREYMFHHYLMEQGYMVLDMDFRASSGYGHDWRTAIYRHMGGKDLDDNVAGATYLVEKEGAGKDRLGLYGGSYGGFITLMAMFTKPGVFQAGAALRPVGDWASYNHGYTSPILNNPQDDREAYKISSPINFCEGLQGSLLICHGMVDVNVAFQDSIRISQRLIELGKKNWWIAPYPVEDHAFRRADSWTDEYRRIFELFETTIGNQRRK